MIKTGIIRLALAAFCIIFITQCTKVAKEENIHPEGWAIENSENFHGNKVKSSGTTACQTCHGEDDSGGDLGISCFDCHLGGPSGHPADSIWGNPENNGFHGNSVADFGPSPCTSCHGTDYTGGVSQQSCYTCHAGGPSGHPADSVWSENPEAVEFHGTRVAEFGSVICSDCHGTNYMGGTSEQSCYTCHAGGPSGHPATSIWVGDPDSEDFHGQAVADNGPSECSTCHGTDYTGGSSEQSCYTCHAGGPSGHPATNIWVGDPDSEGFHGRAVADNGPSECSTCHGTDYTGGTSEQSCYTCHAGGPSGHPASTVWLDQSSDDYHGKIFWDNGWDLTDCQACHGNNYEGGVAEKSCGSCHTGSDTELFTCFTCHGNSETEQINPPNGIMGETAGTSLSVGAHEAHLSGGTYSTVIACNECHNVPDSWDADGHLGTDNRAEIIFGTLASGNGTVIPEYEYDSGTCSNVYCHGNFVYGSVSGNNTSMIWTSSDGTTCTTCHNIAPVGHFGSYTEVTQCYSCHPAVVGADGNIINKSLHINGTKNTIE